MFVARRDQAPNHVAFQVPDGEDEAGGTRWRDVTTREFFNDVEAMARQLVAAGITPGKVVAIMGPTRYAWVVADVASLWVGAVVVPIYDTSAPAQVRAILEDSQVVRAFAGTAEHARMLTDVLGDPALVWTMDDEGGPHAAMPELIRTARETGISDADLEDRRTAADLDTLATIVYTSGTTSDPKGVMLTHGNFVGQLTSIGTSHRQVLNADGTTILFLPLSHVLARGVQLICLSIGMRVTHLSDTTKVIPTFGEVRPSFVMVVPRVLEKILAAVGAKANAKHLGPLWRDARRTAVRVGEARQNAGGAKPRMSLALRARHALYDRLFYSKIRALLGDQVRDILCGGARLHPELALAFRGFGIPIIEGYGLTETTAPITANLPGDLVAGTVGPPVPGSTVRISETGEVLVKGPGVAPGYKNPAHTEAAYVDGFLRTGDLGSLDADGRLRLNGRCKDVIVTSGGKTVEPAGWESSVERHPRVAHAVAVGDDRPFLTALIIEQLDEEVTDQEVSLVDDPALVAELEALIQEANSEVSRTEQIKRFALVRANLADPALMTPSMKLRRTPFLERAREAIDALYVKAPHPQIHDVRGADAPAHTPAGTTA
ncbi:MAG: long-chain fatty acid--CoA ligase [Dermabacter sp.]|nr:long-chain fatty acid--CoA ligase [Dermabacter sp.]